MTASKTGRNIRTMNKKSVMNTLGADHDNRKTFDAIWNLAHKAPYLCKKPRIQKFRNKETGAVAERKVMPTVRILNAHKHKTLVSAAFAAQTQDIGTMSERLRSTPELEDMRAPALPRISHGFCMLLEQGMVAYTQQVISRAKMLQEGMHKQTKHKKITFRAVDVAAKAVTRDLFAQSGLATHLLVVPKLSKRTAKDKVPKKKKSAD